MNKWTAAALLTLLVVVATSTVTIAASIVRPYHYEHVVFSVPDSQLPIALQQAGDQGWEIVSARRAGNTDEGEIQGKRTFAYELILSRKLHPFIQPPSITALMKVARDAEEAEARRLKAEAENFVN